MGSNRQITGGWGGVGMGGRALRTAVNPAPAGLREAELGFACPPYDGHGLKNGSAKSTAFNELVPGGLGR